MKKVAIYSAECLLIILLIVIIPFTLMWADHTKTVRGWIMEDIQEYKSVSVDWNTVSNVSDEALKEYIVTSISAQAKIMHVDKIRENATKFKESLYFLNGAIINKDSSIENAISNVARAQNEYYELFDRVENDFLWLMQQTF
jgi:hypothetical protein